jgi:phosphatidylglycerol---prolipoprotein diacylglyceryl transferase
MLPILQVGPLALQVPGLVLLLGLWLGLNLAERRASLFKIRQADLYNLAFLALIAGIIGARLTYLALYPSAFAASPWSLFSLNPGLLDPVGGISAAGIAGLVFVQRKNLPFWNTLDALTPLLAVLQVATGLSNLASGDAFGAPADLPWAIYLWGLWRHPSQIYESLAGLLILAALLGLAALRRLAAQPGLTFLAFLSLSAASRLFLEAFRGDSPLTYAGLRTPQLAAWLVLALALWGLGKRSGNLNRVEGSSP